MAPLNSSLSGASESSGAQNGWAPWMSTLKGGFVRGGPRVIGAGSCVCGQPKRSRRWGAGSDPPFLVCALLLRLGGDPVSVEDAGCGSGAGLDGSDDGSVGEEGVSELAGSGGFGGEGLSSSARSEGGEVANIVAGCVGVVADGRSPVLCVSSITSWAAATILSRRLPGGRTANA